MKLILIISGSAVLLLGLLCFCCCRRGDRKIPEMRRQDEREAKRILID